MITKYKIFENINKLPKLNDYVILDKEPYKYSSKIWYDFISSSIGQIIDIRRQHGGTSTIYRVKFDNTPENYLDKKGIGTFTIEFFDCWSSNRSELELILDTKKYNL